MKKINLKTSNTNVPIYVGDGILNNFEISKYVFNKDVLIITNTKVGKLYINKTMRLFKKKKENCLFKHSIHLNGSRNAEFQN